MSDDNQNQPISEELRSRVYELLADAMIKGLEMKNPEFFNAQDSEDSAELIATKLDILKTKSELLLFLKQLADQWEVYRPVYLEFEKDELMKKVQEELQKLQK